MASAPRGHAAFVLASVGVLWAAGFTWWALTASVYSSGQTILEVNPELLVRVAIATPLVVSVVVWGALHAACRADNRRAQTVGIALACVLVVFSVISGFSIGMAVLPGAAALTVAAVLTPVT